MTGRLFGVGVGPGDPELLTLKAARVIGAADVVACIGANDAPSRARAIAAAHIPPGRREHAWPMPMGCRPADAEALYDRIAAVLATELEEGRDVAFLCEGDPLLYGSFMYVMARMASRFACQVVPGVTSVTAAAACAYRPLAAHDETLTLVPATRDGRRLEAALASGEPVVILKVGRYLGRVREALTRAERMGEAILVEHATTNEERIRPLSTVDDTVAPYFSVILAAAR